MGTNWRDFGIGMASGIALCFVLYFGWGLIHPRHPDPVGNVVATSNASAGMDENALIAANAERPQSNNMTPPPQLRPQPRNDMMGSPDDTILPDVRPAPPVNRPRPRPRDEPPPEDVEPDDDGGKPDY
ncbi:hypothetical protein [Allosphingosinicella sp.]|uniref:hypothetical protein n=1 Tax=Allosphingosinicella sp. TaxID=2823234 RepID=UPI003782D5B8